MTGRRIFAVLAVVIPTAAFAHNHEYPTVGRVEYVLECMRDHGGKQEYLYKCSCAIDEIAKQLPYDDFVEAATAARYQNLPGERGGLFRDPDSVRNLAKSFKALQTKADKMCFVK